MAKFEVDQLTQYDYYSLFEGRRKALVAEIKQSADYFSSISITSVSRMDVNEYIDSLYDNLSDGFITLQLWAKCYVDIETGVVEENGEGKEDTE